MIFGISFLILSNIKVDFNDQKLQQRSYTTIKALSTIKKIKLIGKKEFIAIVLDLDDDAFIIHIIFIVSTSSDLVHLSRRAQIALPKVDEVLIAIPSEYADFANIVSPDLIAELPKHIRIKNHAIRLINDKQPPYKPIYSQGLMELEILKIYIETNLANGLIMPSKSSASTSILFVQKSDSSFCLCMNYQGLNNLIIKDRYPLLLIGKSQDRLGWAKCFMQFDLTSANYRMRIHKRDKQNTVFRTWFSHFKYQVILFDLSNTSASL